MIRVNLKPDFKIQNLAIKTKFHRKDFASYLHQSGQTVRRVPPPQEEWGDCYFNANISRIFRRRTKNLQVKSNLPTLDTSGQLDLNSSALSPNPFPLFRYFTWRRIGEPISDRHFLYLLTLSRNIGNGFGLSQSNILIFFVPIKNFQPNFY